MTDKPNPIVGDINKTFPEWKFANADYHEEAGGYLDIILSHPTAFNTYKAIRIKAIDLNTVGIVDIKPSV